MAEQNNFTPLVSSETRIPEFTGRALILGALVAMLMGAANSYLGLKAGMTIAATYTAAIIAIAVIRAMKGTVLEENFARTVGSIGGNVASGAIFTLPAFFIVGIWSPFFTWEHYLISTAALIVAGILGIMFASLIRRSLVEDAELPFPESIAAAEIHKSAQKGSRNSRFLLSGLAIGAVFKGLVDFSVIAESWQRFAAFAKGGILLKSPNASPAYMGVGYIIGPKLASINFSGGLLAWGLLAPAIAYFLHYNNPGEVADWQKEIASVWKNYVRYIAIGGMLVGAFYTLYRMRQNLFSGMKRSFANLKKASADHLNIPRTERDLNIRLVLIVIAVLAVAMLFVNYYFSQSITSSIIAMFVMLIVGFVFAAVSGYLVGIIGVSNNPTSGLTVSILIIVAFIMLLLGLRGAEGIAAALGVAALTCASVSVAGEMMQDLKAGQILNGTPWKMQAGDIIGVTAAALMMFLVISLYHLGDIKKVTGNKLSELEKQGISEIQYQGKKAEYIGKTFTLNEIKAMEPEKQNEILGTNAGFGGEKFPAPQASLMAVVSKGIIEYKTEWILIVIGMFMSLAFILMQVKSPMLIAVGMYLPIETSFAIFIGGLIKGISDYAVKRKNLSQEAADSIGNAGVLIASGLIVGEALFGLIISGFQFAEIKIPVLFKEPSYLISLAIMLLVGWFMIWFSGKTVKK